MTTRLPKNFAQLLSGLVLLVITIATASSADDFCWKDSYGRGAGVIPRDCGGGKEYQGGLCYDPCPEGMTENGPVCWSQCPSGYTDMGAVCHINQPLTKSPDWVCTHHFPKWMGGRCRWKDSRCPSGYTNAGLFCALTQGPTPAGFSGTYLDPMKNSHGRGVGSVPKACGEGQEYDAGLCYTSCRTGYYGVGPVCWSRAPTTANAEWVTCGMGNARNSLACSQVVFDQVSSVASVALSVATLGASAEAEEGAEAESKLAEVKEEYASMKQALNESKNEPVNQVEQARDTLLAAKNCVDAGMSAAQAARASKTNQASGVSAPASPCRGGAATQVGQFTMDGKAAFVVPAKTAQDHAILVNAANALPPASEEAKFTAADYARVAAQLAALVDPSGVAGTVAAYSYPKCSALFK